MVLDEPTAALMQEPEFVAFQRFAQINTRQNGHFNFPSLFHCSYGRQEWG
ncbi:MAG: hypothetical protein IPQ19_15310 [Bacteroidetes bacterium]|nr:hypothetical protein [Bacteroidota bacterium]